ncbi:hypothetical protein GCM10010106_29530 [Thermopolyspora flexuosa]|jgi:hypothetical protein|uniref:Secreted protein n=1 Tax=Thermopolyspora flexuosa TaxID=103836 RepID=A0A543IS65_9ACTN|nr:hypothetical protein [Thermopolyspora flexuosa]TQM73419.1 hypothetical protein FHX40_0058 [Thermopolyspora flexuosa]GGM80937.1 hypothetical protein GCM10010106_29530 [Thermopolyspora flexuosa]
MRKRSTAPVRALATGVVAAAALAALTAVPAEAIVMRPPGPNERCSTGTIGQFTGYADCINNNNHPIEVKAVIICGLWFDRHTDWVVIHPGRGARLQGSCTHGSGVGGVIIDVRDR